MSKTTPTVDIRKTGVHIHNLRLRRKMSAEKLAYSIGLNSANSIFNWENGLCLPNVDSLYRLSKVFGMSMEDLIVVRSDANE